MKSLRLFWICRSFWSIWVLVICPFVVEAAQPILELRKGDHICLVGNALGERMQFDNYWESILYQRFPEHELVVRNLCFPADEPIRRDRSLNFGTPDQHLSHSKADVILFFFGANEAFRGNQELDRFVSDLTKLVRETKTKNYSGKGAPRIVLVSPIAREDLHDPNISSGREHQSDLRRYTEVMKKIATDEQVGFVDLFLPTLELFETGTAKANPLRAIYERPPTHYTINSFHLSDYGNKIVASILDERLFGGTLDPAKRVLERTKKETALREAISDKNFHWWHRYRAVNGYSIYGKRGEAGSDGTYRNREVMEREREILDAMCHNRDQRIWELAQGKTPSGPVDDSNTLPFITPKTNVGGPNDPNQKAGKLGTLDYLSAAEQQKQFKLAPGYEIELVASEEQFPDLAKPVAINFDRHGRLWVATMPSYPQWQPKSPLNDKLLILEDDDGDGRADRCKVFADKLHQPTGFELGCGGVFVAQQPDILFLKDTNGDDRADERVRRLTGFDTADSHHGICAFEWGPDGALYFQEGTFKQSQVESAYGPVRLGDAGVWRYEPRTERLQVHVSLAFANPWGHVFDRWGQNFIADASPGFNYWAAPISGRVEHPDKHPGGSRAKHLDWGGSKGSGDYPPFLKKRIRPSSGCEFVASRQFPPEAQGSLLLNNVIGDLGILQFKLRDEGSGFDGEELPPLVLSEHGNFRPVDLQFGPDGALYIVDWHNALIGHLQHNLREPNRDHSHGRIWRVKYSGRPLLKAPKIADEPIPALLELLNEPEDRTRYRVRRELAERSTAEVVKSLKSWCARLDATKPDDLPLLLEGLWLYQTHNVVEPTLLATLLNCSDFRVRAAATRVLSEWRDRVPDYLPLFEARVHDPHPRARLEAVRGLSFIESPKAIELALDVLNYDTDDNIKYTLEETLRAVETRLSGSHTAENHEATSAGKTHDPHAGHEHSPGNFETGSKPILFLEKNPKVLAYQLARLSIPQLLQIDRTTDDPKSAAVFAELLVRAGVSRGDRSDALRALIKIKQSDSVTEILAALKLGSAQGIDLQTQKQLATLMLSELSESREESAKQLQEELKSENDFVRKLAFAGMIAGGQEGDVWRIASASPPQRIDYLESIELLPNAADRENVRERVIACLVGSQPLDVRRAAIKTMPHIPAKERENCHRVAEQISSPQLRMAVIRSLLQFRTELMTPEDARRVVAAVVQYAETVPTGKRTSDDFIDSLQLCDQLLPLVQVADARRFRERIREVSVRVVRIQTVQEEMRYDTPFFVVEAGRPVQLILKNEDVMPHNLAITAPGALRDVAAAAASMSPQPDSNGLAYVPKSDRVVVAMRSVDVGKQESITFNAPDSVGEYPYVCTFPNHWMRMYGVMVVVKDLDAWRGQQFKPVDPLGNTRDFVKAWTVGDFQSDAAKGLQGRSAEIGKKIFREATCSNCHKVKGEGGAVGPELTGVLKRQQGDVTAVIREVVDPSHKIDPKWALYNIALNNGQVISGVIAEQTGDRLTVISNPDKPQPIVVSRDEIDTLQRSTVSMMPKGLLDRFTRDEIFELISYILAE